MDENKELINVIDNLPEELFVTERFSGITFCNEYYNPFVIALTKRESSVAFKRTHKFIQKVAESFKAYLEILGYQGYIRLYDYE